MQKNSNSILYILYAVVRSRPSVNNGMLKSSRCVARLVSRFPDTAKNSVLIEFVALSIVVERRI